MNMKTWFGLLTLGLIFLKIIGYTSFSWWWIIFLGTIPFLWWLYAIWFAAIVAGVTFVCAWVVAVCMDAYDEVKYRRKK